MVKDGFRSQVRIVQAMQKARKPLILQHIAKKSKLTPQLTSYHLKRMVEWGIVNVYNEQDKALYVLQTAYYDEDWLEAFFAISTPYLEAMSKNMDLSQTDEPAAKVLIRNFSMMLRLFESKIDGLIRNKLA